MLKSAAMTKLFRTVLIAFLFSGAAHAQLAPAPVLPPTILDSSIKIPTFDLGDWNSSGDMHMAPDVPEMPDVAYSCQLQLTDGIERRDRREESFKRYQIAEIRLDRNRTYADAEELKWFGKRFYSNERIEDASTAAPFRVDGSWVSLSLASGRSLALTLNVRQHLGEVSVDQSRRTVVSLADSTFEAQVATQVTHARDPRFPRMSMRAVCHKIK